MNKKEWKFFGMMAAITFVFLFIIGILYFNAGLGVAFVFSLVMTSAIGSSAYMESTRGRRR